MTEGGGRAVAQRVRNGKAPTLLPGRAEHWFVAFAYPVSFRCHQAPLDRPLTVGMVVDAPHNPGQIVSSDRFLAPSGLVPARLFRCLSPLSGAFNRRTYPPSSNANIGSSTPVPETETPWHGLYQGSGQDAIRSGLSFDAPFVQTPAADRVNGSPTPQRAASREAAPVRSLQRVRTTQPP